MFACVVCTARNRRQFEHRIEPKDNPAGIEPIRAQNPPHRLRPPGRQRAVRPHTIPIVDSKSNGSSRSLLYALSCTKHKHVHGTTRVGHDDIRTVDNRLISLLLCTPALDTFPRSANFLRLESPLYPPPKSDSHNWRTREIYI